MNIQTRKEIAQANISVLEDKIKDLSDEYIENNDCDLYWIIDAQEIELNKLKIGLLEIQREIDEEALSIKIKKDLQKLKMKLSKDNVFQYNQNDITLLHISKCRKYLSYKVSGAYFTTDGKGYIYK